jgi:hypothetical protein
MDSRITAQTTFAKATVVKGHNGQWFDGSWFDSTKPIKLKTEVLK